ncbi:HGGxSTG domain-containing protein [Bradyrhizobium sp. Mp27]|uniref:HGGxSTG domain-containing protein n=1 Tax=Bradyrhizobium sp. Mp27 TaxID=3042157 RepID=UPI00248C08FE|nr:HGGxSTG domain-containing protein [Bradyrhizobium sp. Mp27]MDI2073044.1 HGGxSTG domain-containing protein [Bradyrhizobium sp. Mp27]
MNQAVETRLSHLRAAQRCGARNRAGRPCECPAIRGRARCRLHGGRSSGAPKGQENGMYKDGYFSAEAIAERRWAKSLAAGFAGTGKDG